MVIQDNIHMIVKQRWRLGGHDPETPRHSEMNHQGASVRVQENIFRATTHAHEAGADEVVFNIA